MKVSLPSTGGTYVLVLYLHKCSVIGIGRLGPVAFKRGWYCYVGSAFGPGGLAARLKRHLAKERKLHWHIDLLLTRAAPKEVWINRRGEAWEHVWAAELLQSDSARPVSGFGCSDCRCPSHLFYFKRYPDAERHMLNVEQVIVPSLV